MALNFKLRTNDGSKRQLKLRLWMLNWRCGSKRQIEDVTLNVKRKKDRMTLNVELKTNNDSERQTKNMALNTKLQIRLWMSTYKEMVALNAKLWIDGGSERQTEKKVALNAKLRRNGGSECQTMYW